ncbi:GNAT family N-acetyltransferase [Noviherbaspirillum aridicola]|uniref:BioF2-like acetyltransferase domain-containing protein n=1 Tax=Noviherbaspirillum aridicola TaxID=2849687 RepID=A0ABQ4Q3C9_9BURK|nr:GNAT family N-acetyltransferase [Noviherbaspirillum aridicola]GIZ51609.1 hypothetical protein NCCP691_16230 [Noviherbaspirillum aridicola]
MTTMANRHIVPDIDKLATDWVLQWLSLDDPDGRAEWERIWAAGHHKRPQDHPAYLQLVRPEGYETAAVVYRHGSAGTVLYPFFHVLINRLPGFGAVQRPLRHLCSPYGYGGALYEGDPQSADAASKRFERLFGAELRERGFVSEFVREDLFEERLAVRDDGERTVQQDNVVIRLQRDPEDIWNHYGHTIRTDVRRASRAGLRLEVDHDFERLDDFLGAYYETMQRRGADPYFYMPRQHFMVLRESFGSHAATALLHVRDGRETLASALVLYSADTLYGFLTASRQSAREKRPNHFMHHSAILWGREKGMRWYVLGGGIAPNDGLFRFKSGFDPGHTLPFRLRRVLHNPHACQMLNDVRGRHEQAQGREWTPRAGFFPPYLA